MTTLYSAVDEPSPLDELIRRSAARLHVAASLATILGLGVRVSFVADPEAETLHVQMDMTAAVPVGEIEYAHERTPA